MVGRRIIIMGKHIAWSKKVKYFHDDQLSDGEIIIPKFPMDNLFGDFRIFNGLPMEVVNDFVGELIDLFTRLRQAHFDHETRGKA